MNQGILLSCGQLLWIIGFLGFMSGAAVMFGLAVLIGGTLQRRRQASLQAHTESAHGQN